MERRLLLVFALTFLVIILFQPLLKKYLPQSAAPPTQTPPPPQSSARSAAAMESQVPVPAAGASKQAASEVETVVDNDLYRITFTNRGGWVKSWILKKYRDDHGKPLELVSNAAEKYGYPLSLWIYDEAQRNKINSALYVASGSGNLSAPVQVTFEYADQDVAVRKAFSFDHTYVVHIETSVMQRGSLVAAFPMWPAGFGDQLSPASYAASRIEHQYNDKTERLDIKKVSGGATVPGPFNWAGVVDQYFAAVFLPDDPQSAAAVTLHNPVDLPKDLRNPNSQETIKADVLGVAVGDLKTYGDDRLELRLRGLSKDKRDEILQQIEKMLQANPVKR